MNQAQPSFANPMRSNEGDKPSSDLRRRGMEAIDWIGELNRGADPDQVMADVTAVVEDVRREKRKSALY